MTVLKFVNVDKNVIGTLSLAGLASLAPLSVNISGQAIIVITLESTNGTGVPNTTKSATLGPIIDPKEKNNPHTALTLAIFCRGVVDVNHVCVDRGNKISA